MMPERRRRVAVFLKYESALTDGPPKQQSRRRCATNGFALSPIRAVFSDSIRRVSKPE
jgi:hypothetical protein